MAPPGLPLQSELSLSAQDGMEEHFDKLYYYAEQIVIDILPSIEFKKCKIIVIHKKWTFLMDEFR